MTQSPILVVESVAAEMLCVKPGTLRQWRSRLMGPPWVEVEGAIRYPVDAINRYIKEHTQDPSRRQQAANG